jgi:hypothetical protein
MHDVLYQIENKGQQTPFHANALQKRRKPYPSAKAQFQAGLAATAKRQIA